MRRTLALILLSVVVVSAGCGDRSDVGDAIDAGIVAADADLSDIADARDGGPLLPRATYEWERVVITSQRFNKDPLLQRVVALPGAVAVLTDVEMVLYDDQGTELGRAPPPSWDGQQWWPTQAFSVSAGEFAISFQGTDRVGLAFYSASDFSLQDVMFRDNQQTMWAQVGDQLMGVGWTLDGPIELHKIVMNDRLAPIETKVLQDPRVASLGFSMTALGNGELLICGENDGARPTSFIVDIGAITIVERALPGAAMGRGDCHIRTNQPQILLDWSEQGAVTSVLLDPDDGSLIAGPTRRTPVNTGGTVGAGFDGRRYVQMTSNGVFYPLDAETLEPGSPSRMEYPPAQVDYGVGFDSTGTHVYAAIGYAIGFGPVVQILQKIPTLP